MGFLDRLFGGREEPLPQQYPAGYGAPRGTAPPSSDEAAIERYRYLLRTAPPDAIEQAHAEAFAQLTPEQRQQVLAQLSAQVPPGERATSDDPRQLARMATRAEMRSPGTLERSLGPGAMGGVGMGGLLAGSLLASVAGAFIGTTIAGAMLAGFDGDPGAGDVAGDGGYGGDEGSGDVAGGDHGGDFGGDVGGGDFGGDLGGFGF